MSCRARRSLCLVVLAGLGSLSAPGLAHPDEGEGSRADVRLEVQCSGTSRLRLRVRARDDDELRVDVDVRTSRDGAAWSVVGIHERRLAFSVRTRTARTSGSFSVRRVLEDWLGPDTVAVRATGPAGETCRAAVTVGGN